MLDLKVSILIGGKSSRMGHDKSNIFYHKTNQLNYSYELLNSIFNYKNIYVSLRDGQEENTFKGKHIYDIYKNVGPLSGILSSMLHFEDSAWLILACDMPNIKKSTIEQLIINRDDSKYLTSYSSKKGFEPLCCIYEKKSIEILKNGIKRKEYSLQKLFNKYPKQILEIEDRNELKNINFQEEY